MDNVQGSIEMDSDSDEEIRPANLSDEFEEIAFVMPPEDEEEKVVEDAGQSNDNKEIMENVQNLVGMLDGEEPKDKQ